MEVLGRYDSPLTHRMTKLPVCVKQCRCARLANDRTRLILLVVLPRVRTRTDTPSDSTGPATLVDKMSRTLCPTVGLQSLNLLLADGKIGVVNKLIHLNYSE